MYQTFRQTPLWFELTSELGLKRNPSDQSMNLAKRPKVREKPKVLFTEFMQGF
jgi:hypothetical protein